MSLLDSLTPGWVKAIPWIVIGLLLMIVVAGGSYGVILYKDTQAAKAEAKKATDQLDTAKKANEALLNAPAKQAKADTIIDVRYRDRFNTIEKVVREKDLTAANVMIRDFTINFYDKAMPVDANAPVASEVE